MSTTRTSSELQKKDEEKSFCYVDLFLLFLFISSFSNSLLLFSFWNLQLSTMITTTSLLLEFLPFLLLLLLLLHPLLSARLFSVLGRETINQLWVFDTWWVRIDQGRFAALAPFMWCNKIFESWRTEFLFVGSWRKKFLMLEKLLRYWMIKSFLDITFLERQIRYPGKAALICPRCRFFMPSSLLVLSIIPTNETKISHIPEEPKSNLPLDSYIENANYLKSQI